MKFEILQEELLKGLLVVARAVAARAQMPVLTNILVEAKKDGVRLTATDLEIMISTRVLGKVTKEGEAAVPAKMLVDLAGALPEGKVELALDKESLLVRAGSYRGKLQTMAAEEFPRIPETGEKGGLEVETGELAEAVGKVIFASAKDVLRPVLTGILLERAAGGLKLVATDGFRLAVTRIKSKGAEKAEKNYLVPARAIGEVAKAGGALDKGEKVRALPISQNQIAFVAGETMVVAQVIDGNFPDYNKIVPSEFETEVMVGREELSAALKTVQIFARENSNMVKWAVGNGKIMMRAEAGERGEAAAEVEAKVGGPGGEIVFNAKFVMDFLQNSSMDTIVFRMNDNLKPGAFGEQGNEDYLYIVMPINA